MGASRERHVVHVVEDRVEHGECFSGSCLPSVKGSRSLRGRGIYIEQYVSTCLQSSPSRGTGAGHASVGVLGAPKEVPKDRKYEGSAHCKRIPQFLRPQYFEIRVVLEF